MRIDFLGAAAAVVAGPESPAARPSPAGKPGETSAVPQDTASLSMGAASVPALTTQALATAAAREARVEALRQAVAGGSYNVDSASIAEAMISESA